jgi:hypothetical protein
VFAFPSDVLSQTDVYALGMLAYELWSEAAPWSGYSASDDITRQVLEGRRPEIPSSVPSDVRPLIARCWHQDALLRPTADEIVQRLDVVVASLPHAAITLSTPTELRQMPPCQFVDRAYFKRNSALFTEVRFGGSTVNIVEWRPGCDAGVFAAPSVSVDGASGVELLGRTVLSCIEASGDNGTALRSGRLVLRSIEFVVVPSTDMKRNAFLEKVSLSVPTATCDAASVVTCATSCCDAARQIHTLALRHQDIDSPDSPHYPKWRKMTSVRIGAGAERPLFKRGSDCMPWSEDDQSFRRDVMSRWRRRHVCALRHPRDGTAVPPYLLDAGKFGDLSSEKCSVPLVHLVYHAVHTRDVALRVFNEGFSVLAGLDPGYFGQGIYFSHDLKVLYAGWCHSVRCTVVGCHARCVVVRSTSQRPTGLLTPTTAASSTLLQRSCARAARTLSCRQMSRSGMCRTNPR